MKVLHRIGGLPVASMYKARGTVVRERKVTRFYARARLLTGFALTVGLVTSGAGLPAATASTSTVRITVGGGTAFADALVYYANDLLKSQGITVELSNLASPASALQSVVAGSSDIYLGDPVESTKAVANAGANLKYIATMAQTTDYVILALPKITMSNLSGATMGSAGPGSAGTTIALAAFKKLGIDPNTIKTVTVGGTSARVTAILAGQIDLAAAHAASAVSAVETGKVKILFNAGSVMGQYLQQGLTANGNFIRKNRALVQSVVNAYMTANRWASTNGPGFIKAANDNKLTGTLTDAQELAAWQQLQSSKYFAVDGAVDEAAINPTLAYNYASGGSLTPATTPAYLKWVDPSFVDKYLLANGFNEAKVVVSQIVGTAVRGQAARMSALGAFFYGKPVVTSNASGTKVRVVKIAGGALDLTLTTQAKTAKGTYMLTFRFAQGQVVKSEYKVG
jgi:ABC-type nitrate/sulfonate/bicarbonate transport system substrate-binding protein